ncbi:MAG TPA: hypothetical protein VFS66_02545 [Acidimicrobiia bacterium]|nr:hypothetical protein [Acidimicrobiia bacterium]
MSRSRRIADYIERQYISEQGSVRENVEGMFAEDLAYHVGGETLSREDVIAAVTAVRGSPRDGRRVLTSGFSEDGDVVTWHISATIPGPDGADLTQENDLRAVFDAEDKIREVWSEGSVPDYQAGESPDS